MGMIVMTVIKCGHDDNAACGAVEQFDKAFISKTGRVAFILLSGFRWLACLGCAKIIIPRIRQSVCRTNNGADLTEK